MKRYKNFWLLCGVVILLVLPLLLVQKPDPGQGEAEIFSGADGQAKELVTAIAPHYKPWLEPVLQPPSGEIESFLFAVQAALGAGFIGYYLGSAATAAKNKARS